MDLDIKDLDIFILICSFINIVIIILKHSDVLADFAVMTHKKSYNRF